MEKFDDLLFNSVASKLNFYREDLRLRTHILLSSSQAVKKGYVFKNDASVDSRERDRSDSSSVRTSLR